MEKKQEYDFLSMGLRAAKDDMTNHYQTAEKIEEQFGINARMEYEAGIAMAIPQYETYRTLQARKKEVLHGSKEFGVENTRNNSYFGTTGTGVQYTTNSEGLPVYNEPKSHRGK